MLFLSGMEQVCVSCPLLVHKDYTQHELGERIFEKVLPACVLPKKNMDRGLVSWLESGNYTSEDLTWAYTQLFVDSNYGSQYYYQVLLENTHQNRFKCPLCKKAHKDNCEWSLKKVWNSESTTYSEFDSILKRDFAPELRVQFVNGGWLNLNVLKNAEKVVKGEKKKKSDRLCLDDCLEAFAEEELLRGDNKWYCGKCKTHQEALKKMDVYWLPNILVI